MNRGYIKLWRKSSDSGWFKNPNLWTFWCWCLTKASHKEIDIIVGYQKVHLMPGDFIFGRRSASIELGMSERTIRTNLDSLRKRKNVTIKTTNKFSIISVINWDIYQSDKSTSDQQSDQQVTSKRPASDHKQECKAFKNVKNKDFLSDSTEYGLSELLFDEILKNNPNQKKPNLQTWAKDIDRMIRLDNRNPDDIRKIIVWAQGDTFWKSNILSAVKLRQHFDKLYLKMTGGKKGDKYDF